MSEYKKTEVLGQSGPSNTPFPQQENPQQVPPIQPPVSAGGPQKTTVLSAPTAASKHIGFLVFMNQDGTYGGRVMPLGERTIVGRDPQCDILVADPSISAQHVAIRLQDAEGEKEEGMRFFAQDLATTNGTIVNGEKIIRQALNDGDKIELGDSAFVFKQV